jgi:ATP-dependent DNA helicase RecG
MPMESLLSENAKNELMAKFGITANTFDHNVMSVLALAIDEGSVTNERLRYSLNMHKGEIADLLRRMVRNHLLVAKGYGRGTSYHLPKESFDILGAKVATSKAKVATSDAKVATSIAKVATSKANIATSGSNMVTSDPYIASLLKKKRLTKSQLYELIKYMCSDWLSLEDLAIATKRKQVYLRNKVLPELLQSKVLEMLYPGTPNHPKQKYKVKD